MNERNRYISDRPAMDLVTRIKQGDEEISPEDLSILSVHDRTPEVRATLAVLGGICIKTEDGTRNEEEYRLFRQILAPSPSEEAIDTIVERIQSFDQSSVQAAALSILLKDRLEALEL